MKEHKMTKEILFRILMDRPIAFHPDVARISGGLREGVFLSQLLYWCDRGEREDGFIWKTQPEWEKETSLSVDSQRTVRKNLIKKNLIEEKLMGVPARLYYRPHFDQIYKELQHLYGGQSSLSPDMEVEEQLDMEVEEDQGSAVEGQQDVEVTLQHLTKITTEITPKITKEKNIYASKILRLYKDKIGKLNTSRISGIKEWEGKYSEKWIIEAIDKAVQYNKKSLGYVQAILENWEKNGKNGAKMKTERRGYLEDLFAEFIED